MFKKQYKKQQILKLIKDYKHVLTWFIFFFDEIWIFLLDLYTRLQLFSRFKKYSILLDLQT
jgi:hypothetical protein